MVLRKLVIAGLSGYACGKLYSQGKAHPEVAIPILEGAAVAGIFGSLLGLGISTHRNLSGYVHTVSLGANFTLTTATFLGFRHWVMSHDHHVYSMTSYNVSTNQKAYMASSFSGGITGILFSLISWKGISPLLMNCLGGFSSGIIAQFCYNIFEQWRKHKAVEMLYAEDTVQEKTEVTMYYRFQKSWMEFWYRKSKAALLEQDILLLEDLIKEETKKLSELDQQLLASEGDRTVDSSSKEQTQSSIQST